MGLLPTLAFDSLRGDARQAEPERRPGLYVEGAISYGATSGRSGGNLKLIRITFKKCALTIFKRVRTRSGSDLVA